MPPPHTKAAPSTSAVQLSKQAYKQRKEAKFIARAKTLTKVARLKKQLSAGQNTYANDDVIVDDRSNIITVKPTHNAPSKPSTSKSVPRPTLQQQRLAEQHQLRAAKQKHALRNSVKQKMNSRTARGQPHLNLQMEVLYGKLMNQNKT